MNKVCKTILPFLFSLLVVTGSMPAFVFNAFAASTVSAKTEEALNKAVKAGGTVKLTKDIALTDTVVVPPDVSVILDLNGKILDRGLADCKENGSVIRVESGATLSVTDSSENNIGTITGGASVNGGGICNYGTLIFEGGTVEGNKALSDTDGRGGGIYNTGSLTMRGGLIRENEALNGGGIYNGGEGALIIEQNVVVKKVGIESVTRITNVTITGNRAKELGNGIYNDSQMSLCDAPSINANGNHDIFISRGQVIGIAGELTFTNKIRIHTSGTNRVVTENYSLYNSKKPTSFFASSDNGTVIKLTSAENGEVMFSNEMENTLLEVYENKRLVISEKYGNPAEAWSKAMGYAKDNKYSSGVSNEASVVEITLGSDWNTDQCLNTGTNKNVVVDLNGHCIKRDGKKKTDGSVFRIGESSKLTVTDSNPESAGYKDHKGGVIADGNGQDCGGGIVIEKYGQLYMNAGTLYNCITDEHGGGINASGSMSYVILKNCTIDSCKTKDSKDDCHGGGIYASKTSNLNLSNVTIKNCESEDKGGGLYLCDKPGYVHLTDVIFESNSANDGGGAIFIENLSSDNEFKFTANNCTFTKNKSNDRGGAVYVNDDDESKYRNPTVFTNCEFVENESKHNGSAVEVNDNGVVLNGGSITGNTTKEKGAVYVEDKYDITVSGKLIIKDNKGKNNNQNLVLEKDDKKAYVYGAGLYKDSEIWISTSEGGTGFAGVKDISSYQSRYFHPEKGTLNFKKTGTAEAEMVTTASLFGEGSGYMIVIMASAAVVIATLVIIISKKRKGAVIDDDEE